ncbi:MAG: hypothetical protein GTO63_34315, partial [Anaerolineae bacterium]|nr:hypothetical protein [Anaerolineae bacterium]NIN99715.1 hypothetical protein [Anaerolineae bacterium]NIQ82567.1 hypothetical protein [Anaerolineae bacterium]
LTDDDITGIAAIFQSWYPQYGWVFGVPSGGERLASALALDRTEGSNIVLIVDDVLTTGKSMEEAKSYVGEDKICYGAVIFARAESWPDWIRPLFVLADNDL